MRIHHFNNGFTRASEWLTIYLGAIILSWKLNIKHMNNKILTVAMVLLLTSSSMIFVAINKGGMRGSFFDNDPSDFDFETDDKVICNATLEDDFANDKVLIVLNREASLSFKIYTPEDFTDVGCSKVEDLTKLTSELVREQLTGEKKEYFENPDEYMAYGLAIVDIYKFRRILCLELTEKNKENVLIAIKCLEMRDDLIWAGPIYPISICKAPNDVYLNP